MMANNHLSLLDYAVFVGSLLTSILIGFYFRLTGDRQRTNNEYLLGNQQMTVFPVAFSLMASFMSAITILGLPAEVYTFGTQFLVVNLSYVIATPICAFVFLPVFYRMRITSVYEYLEKRFNKNVRLMASSIFTVQMTLYMAIVLYAPALALSAVTGIDKWTAIISVGLVCTIYCTIGGIKAVLWTDVLQSILMLGSMVAIIVKGLHDVGLSTVWSRAQHGNRIEFLNLDLDPRTRHTVWSLALGGVFIYISIYGFSQTQVQRLMTVKSLKKAQIALFLSLPITSLLSFTTAFSGLILYAIYWKCDPLNSGKISSQDQLIPFYIIESLTSYPGLPGFIIAGIFSGSLSTVSSFVNSLAAVAFEDYVKPYFFKNRNIEASSANISKILVLFFGFLCIALTYVVDKTTGLLQASLTVFGVVGGPLSMLFTAGICFRFCNSIGVSIGFVVSLIIGFWFGFGALIFAAPPTPLFRSTEECLSSTLQKNLSSLIPERQSSLFIYEISYMWYAFLTWAIGLVISLLTSVATGGNKTKIEDNLLTDYSISFLNVKKSVENKRAIDEPRETDL